MKTPLLFTSLILLLSSCEDVIHLDLESFEPKLVITGTITDTDNRCIIELSRSGDYFDPGPLPGVTGADVTVTDQYGQVYRFDEESPGTYVSGNLKGMENVNYSLKVKAEGRDYSADVTMPQKVRLSKTSLTKAPGYMEFSGGYLINAHLTDPAGLSNYYRIKVYPVGDPAGGGKTLNLFDDGFVDGKEIVMQWSSEQFFPRDTVVVELQTLDVSTYKYYSALASLSESGFIGNANPADPENNISNDALGYFGACTVSRDTLVIPSETIIKSGI